MTNPKTKYALLVILLLVMASCSRTDSSNSSSGDRNTGKLKIGYDTGFKTILEEDMDVRFGTWDRTTTDRGTFVTHAICLSNSYMSGSTINKEKTADRLTDPLRVCFTLTDKLGTGRGSPITLGEYRYMGADTASASQMPSRLVAVGISAQNGTIKTAVDTSTGFASVKILKCEGKEIAGEISAGDGTNKVVGDFHIVTK